MPSTSSPVAFVRCFRRILFCRDRQVSVYCTLIPNSQTHQPVVHIDVHHLVHVVYQTLASYHRCFVQQLGSESNVDIEESDEVTEVVGPSLLLGEGEGEEDIEKKEVVREVKYKLISIGEALYLMFEFNVFDSFRAFVVDQTSSGWVLPVSTMRNTLLGSDQMEDRALSFIEVMRREDNDRLYK
ncbi:hypothetical protein QVD17_18031 [Tagetes erecta]|uniref:Uncharacterized protein n=1 Tax=Tagetes erecta TaxID=13708 RepID=A0AAD8NNK3_TARER|nr:hypothetical protein QVD17_18031 [Tagetes erecta]